LEPSARIARHTSTSGAASSTARVEDMRHCSRARRPAAPGADKPLARIVQSVNLSRGVTRGRYRIQTVSEMTGVPAATLRAWERRYGIPSPERTESAYRLYSDRDIELIQRLRGLCADGMAPAEAARLVHRTLRQDGRVVEEDPFAAARAGLLDAIQRFDPAGLELAVRRAMFLGAANVVFEEIVGPAMHSVGEAWRAGTCSIAQEHLASEILGAASRDLLRLVRPEGRERHALLACFADEDHVLPLYGVAFRSAQWGFWPVLLGARTPPEALADAIERLQPSLIGLSVTVSPSPGRGRELATAYAKACAGAPWVVGGAGSEPLREAIEHLGGLVVGRQEISELKPTISALVARHQRSRRRASA
jgi:DNA-binding transcriptional MerR regulator